jgi:diguanylate cyclase (GGDEF)-like protein
LRVALDPHVLAGITALTLGLVVMLVYFYRQRPFIAWWMVAWLLLGASMLILGNDYSTDQLFGLALGASQFLGVLSSLAFVVAADAYRRRPRIRRGYGLVLLGVAIFFFFTPVAFGPDSVRTVGYVVIAGGMLAAAVAHLLLLRQARMLGPTIVGLSLLLLGGINIWIAAIANSDTPDAVTPALITMTVVSLITALGQQLLAFEDMTFELQRTNRRLEKAQHELRQMVITDPLTGTRNRRFFNEVIGRELNRHRRYRTPLSIVFIDVDHFKEVNDTLGHETGDRVLKDVAAFLVKNIRDADYVFRWGGDEFLVLITCREAEAIRRAKELQHAFAKSPVVADLPPGVALSIGCVEVPNDTEDIMPLVQTADERMYAEKKRRR